jgi:hypothetical protein
MTMPQTTNMTLRRTFPGTNLQEISIRGDGNCAYNALSLGILLKIIDDSLILADDRFAELWQHVVNSVNLLTKRDESYCLTNFINFVDHHKQRPPTFDEFKTFAKTEQNSRAGLYGLHLGLAPALRSLECAIYRESVKNAPNLSNENKLAFAARAYDTVWVSEQELNRVATHVGLQVNAHKIDKKGIFSEYGTNKADVAATNIRPAVVNLVNVGEHWNLLVDPQAPSIKTLEGAKVIPEAAAQQPTAKDQVELNKEQKRADWVNEKVQDASKLLDDWSVKGADAKEFGKAFDKFVAAIIQNDEKAFSTEKSSVEKEINAQQATPRMTR